MDDSKTILFHKNLAQILILCPDLNEYETFYLMLINKYGDLIINDFFVSAGQNVFWLDISRLMLHFMPCACKGYKPTCTSEIKLSILR